MIILKCKMCGGDLHPVEKATTCECEFCGSVQTIPNADDEKKMNLFNRAQRLLRACEFDKAAGVYESIVAEFPEEAEAYWGLVLCKYGIEYVDDPNTGKKIPTCHRSSFDSVMDDTNFEQATENADPIARRVYRDEAKTIEELRKGIIDVSSKEEPYDIFICYKETDENGNRTLDSVLAQDIYDALTEKGYKVFFARITLEDKLGQEYEPYIFAALNSAKVMLAVGTDYEYYNAVWVKNEWSRFLRLIASGEKKTLIPCYKNIDAYDMPKEFAKLQAQDMGKVGAMQDLVRGIGKLLSKEKGIAMDTPSNNKYQIPTSPNIGSLYKRAIIFLRDSDFQQANTYFEKVLDIDPEFAPAYIGKVLVALKLTDEVKLSTCSRVFSSDPNWEKALEYADSEQKRIYQDYEMKNYSNLALACALPDLEEKKEDATAEKERIEYNISELSERMNKYEKEILNVHGIFAKAKLSALNSKLNDVNNEIEFNKDELKGVIEKIEQLNKDIRILKAKPYSSESSVILSPYISKLKEHAKPPQNDMERLQLIKDKFSYYMENMFGPSTNLYDAQRFFCNTVIDDLSYEFYSKVPQEEIIKYYNGFFGAVYKEKNLMRKMDANSMLEMYNHAYSEFQKWAKQMYN